MPVIKGIAHVELSVTDLDKSVAWYQALLSANEIFRAGNDEFAIDAVALQEPVSRMIIAFTQHRTMEPGLFSPRRAGLDHLALSVANPSDLAEWLTHMDALGVEHGGIEKRDFFEAIVATDPDGIPVEFICRK